MKLKDFSFTMYSGWDAAGQELVNAFLMDKKPYESIFNWERKSGVLLLSPYPERIAPYSESDYEITYPTSVKYNGLINLEKKKWVYLSLRQKHGKYPNLHPSGFQNYQRPFGKKLYLNQSWFLLNSYENIAQGLNNLARASGKSALATSLAAKSLNTLYMNNYPIGQVSKVRFTSILEQNHASPLPRGKLSQPIIGYRNFRIIANKDVVIASISSNKKDWQIKGPTKAICAIRPPFFPSRHHAPEENCTCGLYSYSSLSLAIRHCSIVSEIVASIVAWGNVIQHDDEGFRAQYAQPIGFLDPDVQYKEKYSSIEYQEFEITKGFFGNGPTGNRSPRVMEKLAEKYQVPIYYSKEAMEMAAKEYGSPLPSE